MMWLLFIVPALACLCALLGYLVRLDNVEAIVTKLRTRLAEETTRSLRLDRLLSEHQHLVWERDHRIDALEAQILELKAENTILRGDGPRAA